MNRPAPRLTLPLVAGLLAGAAGSANAATPGGPGDLSPHIDIGVDADTGQLAFGFTDIEPDTPIVLDTYFTRLLPGLGGGFASIPFTAEQDLAFRTATTPIATELGFTSFDAFGEGRPQIASEIVEPDPGFLAFASKVIGQPGESFILNVPGQFLDFHPTYIVATDDPDFIGRVEASFRFVPLTSTDVFSPSEPFDFIFVVGGDYDDDFRLTFDDYDLLQDAVATGLTDPAFDLNRDEAVDELDLAFWLDVLAETTLPVGLAGDFNNNGSVEQGDLDLVLGNWGAADTPATFLANTDGLTPGVDQDELDAVLGNWGASASPGPTTDVPEPAATLALLGLAGAALRRRPA